MRRAIGIIRVSNVGGREGESFASPAEQRSRIVTACERDGLDLVETIDELDVSGGTPLERRDGLRAAVEAIEANHAEVIVAAYFDRLVRSLKVQEEVVSRVEAAGGRVLAVDVGQVSGASAAQWLSGTMLGAVNEYYRRSAGERTAGGQARAVARGVPPFPNTPPGYVRGKGGALEPVGGACEAVTAAFAKRAEGATIREIRAFLRSHGIERSYAGVRKLLSNRIYLGELRFGKLFNPTSHEPLTDRDTFERVQQMKAVAGRFAHSDRLLARLGVLRCGTCGARMVVGSGRGSGYGVYRNYRCPSVGDCPRRVTISAEVAERVVVEAVRDELADVEGRASTERDAQQAAIEVDQAQADLDAAIRLLTDFEDEPAARERLTDLRARRDAVRAEAHRLSRLSSALTIRPGAEWDALTLGEQRDFIRAVIDRAEVFPGKGPERIRIHLRT